MTFTAVLNRTEPSLHPCSKAVCIGRNYAAHAQELNNPVPTEPLLFIKPTSALIPVSDILPVDSRFAVHYELEITVLIGKTLTSVTADEARNGIIGIGLGLDLTRRELQSKLKEKGHPWEKAKAFDASGIVSPFIPVELMPTLDALNFSLEINGELKQRGNSGQMITPIIDLIQQVSEFFTLQPGDILFTGTPAGVGQLTNGDQLTLTLDGHWQGSTTVKFHQRLGDSK